MPPAPGLNVVNDGAGDGIIGGTVDASGIGVHGVSSAMATPLPAGTFGYAPVAVLGESWDFNTGVGVLGYSQGQAGVIGTGTGGGVYGYSQLVGVSGAAIRTVGITTGVGVLGQGGVIGVHGWPDPWYARSAKALYGVVGESDSDNGVGVAGTSDSGVGVVGYTTDGVGVLAYADPHSRDSTALVTEGDALIKGGLYVTGGYPKSALIKFRDGSHRALYCVESPECWFEDFGRGRLVRGKARVRLDRTFAAVVRTGDYHVFLSPEGLSHGLYVSRRSRDGFEVREQHRGTSTVRFSYRIVARRKDVDAPRFKRVKLPKLPKLPSRPPRPKSPTIPKAVLELMEGRESPRARRRTR